MVKEVKSKFKSKKELREEREEREKKEKEKAEEEEVGRDAPRGITESCTRKI